MRDDVGVNSSDRLRGLAVVLAVLSVLGAVGVAVTAGVVQSGEETDRSGTLNRTDEPGSDPTGVDVDPGHDYSGWRLVVGKGGGTGSATYRIPADPAWEPQTAADPVSYRGADEQPYVSGHAASFYYGNDCSEDGQRVPAAWAVLGDPERGGDLSSVAQQSARLWARGLGTGEDSQAPVEEADPVATTLADGTPAVRVRIDLDMAVFDSACFDDAAELTVVAFEEGSSVKSLVVARYLEVSGGVGDEEYAAILDSLDP